MKKIILTAILCIALNLSLTACSQQNGSTQVDKANELNAADMFTERDKEITYSNYVTVKLADDGSTVDGAGVRIDGKTVTITEEGTYRFSGTLSDGQIVVDTTNETKLQIVLDGVSIQNPNSAAIYIKQADKVFLTTSNGSKNTLSVTGDYIQTDDNTVDSVIYSKDDLTLNGAGTLSIQAAYGHGVVSKNDLLLTSGTYEVSAAQHAFFGQDSVRIADGSFAIQSGKDAIHAENTTDVALGFLYIANGEFSITSETDGISASSTLQVDGGNFYIKTGGGSESATMLRKEDRPGPEQLVNQQTINSNKASSKGIKTTGNLIIKGGHFQINSFDDALHTNSNCYIKDGNLEISSGDDGVHADSTVEITGGTLTIAKSYEGIEGKLIHLAGGMLTVVAADDGINASSGVKDSNDGEKGKQEMFQCDPDCSITIIGGVIKINASGDGVDSNGNLIVTGGETYVSGPTDDGNAAMDYAGEASISGGIFVAAGSSGMAQNFGSNSTQGSMLVMLKSSQAGEISLQGDDAKQLIDYFPEKQFQSVVISTPQIIKGKTYSLKAGNETQSIEMADMIVGNGHEMREPGELQNRGGIPPHGTHPDAKQMMENNG